MPPLKIEQIKPIQTAECSICHKLHKVESIGWLLIAGRVTEPGLRSPGSRYTLLDGMFGTEDSPAIICRTSTCLIKLVLKDDEDY